MCLLMLMHLLAIIIKFLFPRDPPLWVCIFSLWNSWLNSWLEITFQLCLVVSPCVLPSHHSSSLKVSPFIHAPFLHPWTSNKTWVRLDVSLGVIDWLKHSIRWSTEINTLISDFDYLQVFLPKWSFPPLWVCVLSLWPFISPGLNPLTRHHFPMSTGPLTKEELCINHTVPWALCTIIILSTCAFNDNGLVTHFDTKGAALLKGGGVCTSLNHNTIYQPHLGVMAVSLFSDFWHGPNDYLLWPQWHTQDYPFLTAIPCQETVPNHLLCMWQGVTKDNFIPLSGILTDGLRCLLQLRITEVMARWNEIHSQVLEYKVKTKNSHIAVTTVDQSMYHTFKWFIGLLATLSQIQYFVTVFERYFLELHAILNYLEIYETHLNGLLPTATETAKTMGAFTVIGLKYEYLWIIHFSVILYSNWYCKGQRYWLHLLIKLEIAMYNILVADHDNLCLAFCDERIQV